MDCAPLIERTLRRGSFEGTAHRKPGIQLRQGDGSDALRHRLFPDPAFYNNLESDADYINYRVYATHDLHHILSGFSLDNFGELGVISISVSQFRFPGFVFVDLVSLMLSFFQTGKLENEFTDAAERAGSIDYGFDLIMQGMEMGIKTILSGPSFGKRGLT